MKIYFASSSNNYPNVQSWIEGAKKSGHTVTFDWTENVEKYGRGHPDHNDIEILRQAAHNDRMGVYDCDVLVNLWTDDQLGALLETGMAIALGKLVWVVCMPNQDPRYSIFWELPQVEIITYDTLRGRVTKETA